MTYQIHEVAGNVGRDPETCQTKDGKKVTTFSLAVDTGRGVGTGCISPLITEIKSPLNRAYNVPSFCEKKGTGYAHQGGLCRD